MAVSRQQRRALARKGAKLYVAKHGQQYGHLSRHERSDKEKQIAKRVFHEAPLSAFEKHVVERPRIIVPEVEIQAEGIEMPEGTERRTPGGIIVID